MQIQTPCSPVDRRALYAQARLFIDEAIDRAEHADADLWEAEEATLDSTRKFQAMAAQGTVNAAMSQRISWYCPQCGWLLSYHDTQQKKVITRAGEVDYARGRYRCSQCEEDYLPADRLNGLEDTGYTLGARMVVTGEAAGEAYAPTSEEVKPEIKISRREVGGVVAEVADWRKGEEEATLSGQLGECEEPGPMPSGEGVALASTWKEKGLAEGTVCCAQLDGAKYRSCERGKDGKFDWREARVGTISLAQEGKQLTREAAGGKSYVGHSAHVYCAERMVALLAVVYATLPALVRGLPLVFVADGGPWWEWVSVYFPHALQILDLYHAGKQFTDVAALLFGEGSERTRQWRAHIREWLREPGRAKQLVGELYRARPSVGEDPEKRHELRKLIAYVREHEHRMRYKEYEDAGLPLGSGGVESAVDQVVSERLRERGRRWHPDNADRMVCLRTTVLSGELPALFARRRQAALNAARPFLELLQHAA